MSVCVQWNSEFKMPKVFLVLALCGLLILSGCQQHDADDLSHSQELLIYCGTTMAAALREIADVFEQRENCTVKIIQDGSGNLYQSLRINQVGDLYFPGSESYMQRCLEENLIYETRIVGFNRAGLMVAKGNPLNIAKDLNNFINGRYRTVVGARNSGSIGRETEQILRNAGIYERAVEQSLFLAVDSKEIVQAVAERTADLGLNWVAAARVEDYADNVDVLILSDGIAPRHALTLGVLKTTYDRELARRFMVFAGSEDGQRIFVRYGFFGAAQ